MKFSWLFNGTLEAHSVLGVYLTVWLVQGGYAAWVAWEWLKSRREARDLETFASTNDRP